MARRDQPGVVTRDIIVTDLSQAIKRQRDFLRWMSRRYQDENPEQSAAFSSGAGILEDIRQELQAGAYDASSPAGKDLFTHTGQMRVLQAGQIQAGADRIRARNEAEAVGWSND